MRFFRPELRNGRNTLQKALMFFIPVMGILSSVLMVFLLTVNISRQLKQQIKLMGMSQGEYFNTLEDGLVENRREQNRSSINKRQAAWNEQLCPEKGPDLVGPLYINKSVPTVEDLVKKMSIDFNGWVRKGGSWKPTQCQARVKMALIIPYRDRPEHLAIFVRHMHPMLKKQNLDYRIFVIEQAGDEPFNRAILFNIGFKEALKFDQYECFVFHDVELIPEDDRNKYSCPSSPRHMSVAVDKLHYRLKYKKLFGGACSFTKEHFEIINGFSNTFWGWGGENDNLYQRMRAKGFKLTRPSMKEGMYKMLQEFHNSGKRPLRELRRTRMREGLKNMDYDGLNSLKYTIKKMTEHPLFTLVTVDVRDAMENESKSLQATVSHGRDGSLET